MSKILERYKNDDLRRFLLMVKKTRKSIDIKKTYLTTIAAMKAVQKKSAMPPEYIEQYNSWYLSLHQGKPNYSVYDSDYFVTTEVWLCWKIYSRKYILNLTNPKIMTDDKISLKRLIHPINSIADLGCGMGYTTAALKELYPFADTIGTNIKGTTQYHIASNLAINHKFKLTDNINELGKRNLIFASEYFEHIIDPVAHLENVINVCQPKVLIVANTFNSPAIGHFKVYKYKNEWIPGRKMSIIWNKSIRQMGYESIKTNIWNNRPAIWIRK